MKRILIVVLIFALAAVHFSSGGEKDGWLTSYENAMEASRQTGKPVLIDFTGSDWCVWCKRLDKEVFSQEEFKQYAQSNLVLMEADFPARKQQSQEVKQQNEKLQKQFGVRGFPTIVIVDSSGGEIARTGYRKGGAKPYVEHLKDLLK